MNSYTQCALGYTIHWTISSPLDSLLTLVLWGSFTQKVHPQACWHPSAEVTCWSFFAWFSAAAAVSSSSLRLASFEKKSPSRASKSNAHQPPVLDAGNVKQLLTIKEISWRNFTVIRISVYVWDKIQRSENGTDDDDCPGCGRSSAGRNDAGRRAGWSLLQTLLII